MEPNQLKELFPLFNTTKPDTLNQLLSIALEREYEENRRILWEDIWGNAVYFLLDGWVKVRLLLGSNSQTLAILGRGEFFGEMAVLDEAPRSTDVLSLCPVKIIRVPAEQFLEALERDPGLNRRLLQLFVRRQRTFNHRFQIKDQPPAVKLANTLVNIAENYGRKTEEAIEIFNMTEPDLADVADITVTDLQPIFDKLAKNKWIEIDLSNQILHLLQFEKLSNLARRVNAN